MAGAAAAAAAVTNAAAAAAARWRYCGQRDELPSLCSRTAKMLLLLFRFLSLSRGFVLLFGHLGGRLEGVSLWVR